MSEALAGALQRTSLEDPDFGAEVRALWQQVRIETTVDHGGVSNTFHGQADKIVQLRDLHGDLNIS
ncbi:MAG: hypothetical protein JWN52_6394 [Actinomycetia bacterium]|nr:hypothetical protein [Actinomycetes bacterium]